MDETRLLGTVRASAKPIQAKGASTQFMNMEWILLLLPSRGQKLISPFRFGEGEANAIAGIRVLILGESWGYRGREETFRLGKIEEDEALIRACTEPSVCQLDLVLTSKARVVAACCSVQSDGKELGKESQWQTRGVRMLV